MSSLLPQGVLGSSEHGRLRNSSSRLGTLYCITVRTTRSHSWLRFKPFGTTIGLAFGADDEILATTARPGVWISSVAGKSFRRGSPLYPADPPPLEEQMGPRQTRVTPGRHTASGLGMIGNSIVLQGFYSYDEPFDWADPPGRDAGIYSLAVYTAEGDHLATLSLPDGVSTAFMKTEPGSGRVFLHSSDPFPQVVQYQLNECSSDRVSR